MRPWVDPLKVRAPWWKFLSAHDYGKVRSSATNSSFVKRTWERPPEVRVLTPKHVLLVTLSTVITEGTHRTQKNHHTHNCGLVHQKDID